MKWFDIRKKVKAPMIKFSDRLNQVKPNTTYLKIMKEVTIELCNDGIYRYFIVDDTLDKMQRSL